VTWELGEHTTLLTVTVQEAEDGAEIVLRHAVGDDEHWAAFGPGAVGVGWDLSLRALAGELEEPAGFVEPDVTFVRACAQEWGAAHAASGADAMAAAEAAVRTSLSYAPDEPLA
jgi:hypothetical protein